MCKFIFEMASNQKILFMIRKRLLLLTIVAGVIAISGTIDLDNLFNYSNQPVPNYINKDNTPPDNPVTDIGATLGRVLFYDKQLSVNGTVSCGSCHLQEFAFGDTALASTGVNGTTGRHAMRLVNARFGVEEKAFWDERAASFEAQATMPIQDHAEMGFSGQAGDPDLDSLIRKMNRIEYYPRLFHAAFGDSLITEGRMQLAIAQFVRSIQSFDSKYDTGIAQTPGPMAPFPNFTMQENMGKMLFMAPPNFDANGNRTGGGAGCAGCHQPPEFDIDPQSGNNGVVGAIGGGVDLTNTRAPSLRDVVDQNGNPNGQFMHNGVFASLIQVISHYDSLPAFSNNPMLDNRLRPGGNLQNLQLTDNEKNALVAFLGTLSGNNLYTDPKWSDPFDGDSLVLLPDLNTTAIDDLTPAPEISVYPNPVYGVLQIEVGESIQLRKQEMRLISPSGQILYQGSFRSEFDLSAYPSGLYILDIGGYYHKVLKR